MWVHFYDQAIRSSGYPGASNGRYVSPIAGAVAGIEDNRQVGEFLENRDGIDIRGVPCCHFECTDAAFAQHDAAISVRENVFSGHKQLFYSGHHAALDHHRMLALAYGVQ